MAFNPKAAYITARMLKALHGKGVDPYNTGPEKMPPQKSPIEKVMQSVAQGGADPYNTHTAVAAKWAKNADKSGSDPFEALKNHHDQYHKNTGKDSAKAIGHAAMFHKTHKAIGNMVPQAGDVEAAQPTAADAAGSAAPASPMPDPTMQPDAGGGYDPYNNSPAGMAPASPSIRR